ncbi:MAG: restriction endonuclease subunit R [Candidatus Bathyarchaeia archaeon]
MNLHEILTLKVNEWRTTNYKHDVYPVIAEVLESAAKPEGSGFRLRPPQIAALETYWYLRLVEKTPHVFQLYRKYFPRTADLLPTIGVPNDAFQAADYKIEALIQKVAEDDSFVREYRLESLRETLTLEYPSYILALAMGAGKTALIGAIISTEFAMASEYPEGPFVQNAVVFAPGLTIIESLRQLAELQYDRVLPPRLYKIFAASVKITFTRDGQKDIPVIRGSLFNLIVTNTERIRIQKETVRKQDLGVLLANQKEDTAKEEVANLRLQTIASLPQLAVFSDEAHHTYGLSLGNELKKVRKTVDYLSANTNVVCVVNTTGTPYYRRKPLLDVVIWYGISQGISDHILKEVGENIKAYSFQRNVEAYVSHVIEDFFKDYATVKLPDGTPAKIAMYFPNTSDVRELRPAIDRKLVELGYSQSLVLEHHTAHESKVDFDRFKLNDSPHRIALLVDRGVEGWDVPALFACALARRLRTSNNFVLQAASRCLRQVPGNNTHARIYLSIDNRNILDQELRENFGETLHQILTTTRKTGSAAIRLRKLKIPRLCLKQVVRTVVSKENASQQVKLIRPETQVETMAVTTLALEERKASKRVLYDASIPQLITTPPKEIDIYTAAVELATLYRIDLWMIYDELRRIYLNDTILSSHMPELARQIEMQSRAYEVKEEIKEIALALVKLDGFDKTLDSDGKEVYTAEITYPVDREPLLAHWENWKDRAGEFGFHYTPYNFDSNPEVQFFEQMLTDLGMDPDDVEDIYFTGATTSLKQTDFTVEYRAVDGSLHNYTPDFVIRRKDGRSVIVEIKDARFEAATKKDLELGASGQAAITTEGRKALAVKKWEQLNPDRLKYEIRFAGANALSYGDIQSIREQIKRWSNDQA